jgi:hypothetical protein
MLTFCMLSLGSAQNPTSQSEAEQPSSSPQPSSIAPAASQTVPTAPSPQASGHDSSPQTQSPDDTQHDKTEEEREIEKKEQSRRILGILPQFGVTNRQDAPPLTPHEKFRLFFRSAFDPVTLGVVGLQAGISQAQDNFPSYGQGMEGYGKRYGAALADSISSNFFSNFAYPVLLKEDPRYFRLGEGSTGHRLLYGIKHEFVVHTDSGGRSFAFSNVLGALTAGSISNAYYPDDDRGFGLTLSRAGIAIMYGTAGGLFNEFWPDIDQKLFHRKSKGRLSPGKPHAN